MKKKSLIILFILALSVSNLFAESYTVRKGDTLFSILSDKYSSKEIYEISQQLKKVYPKYTFQIGTKIFRDKDKITINVAANKDIVISNDINDNINVTLNEFEYETVNLLVKGNIEINLFDAVKSIGEDLELAVMLANIFEWEIDFFKDLRKGDKFAVIIEKKFIKNQYAGYGKIIAADFYNNGEVKRATYYQEEKIRGYFDDKGRSLERGFLRVPLNYARISSRFTNSRKHPIFGDYRAHYGVDYAAPRGTPVMATATGVVERMSYQKANGNYIALRHSNGYKTYYLHLHGFNKALRVGSKVNQGQIIGYVGSTGYSTGPHLDYRINKSGRWINPLKFIASSTSIPKSKLNNFYQIAENHYKLLDNAFPIYVYTPNRSLYMMEF